MKNVISSLSIVFCLIFLTSCVEDTKPAQETVTPIAISETEFHTTLPSGLAIDAYELEGPPSTEPLVFIPVSDHSQEQILALHDEDRKQWFSDNTFFDDMAFGMTTQFDDRVLIAREEHIMSTEPNPGSQTSVSIKVILEDEVIYSADAGDGSPLTSLQGLWSYNQDWILEYAKVTTTYSETDNTMLFHAIGHLVRNGILLNEQYSFDEIFGFQLMKGKPFYFLKKDGQIGISYDEQITMLGFEGILHYGCCSAGILNPNRARNMVSFFAQKDSTWYYVEIGVFE